MTVESLLVEIAKLDLGEQLRLRASLTEMMEMRAGKAETDVTPGQYRHARGALTPKPDAPPAHETIRTMRDEP